MQFKVEDLRKRSHSPGSIAANPLKIGQSSRSVVSRGRHGSSESLLGTDSSFNLREFPRQETESLDEKTLPFPKSRKKIRSAQDSSSEEDANTRMGGCSAVMGEDGSPESRNRPDENIKSNATAPFQRWFMTGLFCVTYAVLMISRETLNVLLPSVIDSESVGVELGTAGFIVALGNLAGLAGKLVFGVVADHMRAKTLLLLVSLCNMLASTILMLAMSPWFLGCAWCLVRFFNAGGWAAGTRMVCAWWPADVSGKAFALLALSSRLGFVLASVVLGTLLRTGLHWRAVGLVGPVLLLVSFFFNVIFFRSTPTSHPAKEAQPLLRGIGYFCCCPYFCYQGVKAWMEKVDEEDFDELNFGGLKSDDIDETNGENGDDAISENVTTKDGFNPGAVYLGVQLFFTTPSAIVLLLGYVSLTTAMELPSLLTLYFYESYAVSKGEAAQLTSLYALGAMTSLVIGGVLYDMLKSGLRSVQVGSMLLFMTAIYGYMSIFESPLFVQAALTFLLGFLAATPYYIPIGAFTLLYGGEHFCALYANILDLTGYLGAATFNLGGTQLKKRVGWWSIFAFAFVAAASATLLYVVYLVREYRQNPSEVFRRKTEMLLLKRGLIKPDLPNRYVEASQPPASSVHSSQRNRVFMNIDDELAPIPFGAGMPLDITQEGPRCDGAAGTSREDGDRAESKRVKKVEWLYDSDEEIPGHLEKQGEKIYGWYNEYDKESDKESNPEDTEDECGEAPIPAAIVGFDEGED